MRYLSSIEIEGLYLIVGGGEFTTADIPYDLVKYIHRWLSEGVIVCISKKTRRKKAVYQLSHDALLHFKRRVMVDDPDAILDLQFSQETMYRIRQETGINFYLLKKRIQDLSDEASIVEDLLNEDS